MLRTITLFLLLFVPFVAASSNHNARPPGIGSATYQWNKSDPVKTEALHLPAHRDHGEVLFKDCIQCHGAAGQGNPGKYPVVAQQFFTVVVKQIEDTKLKARDNPEMLPHVLKLKTAQDVADVADYVSSLPRTTNNQKGPEDSKDLAMGAAIYSAKCATCHNPDGSGDVGNFYPRINGQHYYYLVKQITEIKDSKRRNANPKMHKAVAGMNVQGIQALSNYISRLQPEVKK